MIFLRLFGEFFMVGLLSIGGGLATLPFLYDLGERTGWYTAGDVLDMLAVSESTPGAIGVNMATFTGYKTAGVGGGVTATLGLIAPSIIIILIIARILKRFMESKAVQSTLYGLRPASVGLIAAAGWSVVSTTILHVDLFMTTKTFASLVDLKAVILAVILFVAMRFTKLHPIIFLLASAAVGIIFGFE